MDIKKADDIITRAYQELLGRPPDKGGRWGKIQSLMGGMLEEDVRKSIMQSKEYQNHLTNIDSLNNNKTLNFIQNFPKNSGYGILGENILNTLVKHGYNVNNIRSQRGGGGSIPYMPYAYTTLILSTPLSFFKSPRSKINIGYTMFEANMIPISWVTNCNVMDRIFVPIKSNVDAFRRSGVNVPIDVVPIGVNVNIYDPSKINGVFKFDNIINSTSAYKFLIFNDGQDRKNNQMIIDAFHQEFNEEINNNEVFLIIRSHKPYNGKNIFWIDRYLEDSDMVLLIKSCDCMISASSGECGDIPILDGMAMEKPVIVSDDHLAHSEMVEEGKTGFLVDIAKWEKAFQHPSYIPELYGSSGEWVVPSMKSLKQKMRYVYDHREIAQSVGKNARQFILQKRTNEISTQKMIDIFNGTGQVSEDTIIIFILGRFGDTLVSLPAAKFYKAQGKHVIWYTSEIYADFYKKISYIDKVVAVPVIMGTGNIDEYQSFWGRAWDDTIITIKRDHPSGYIIAPSIYPKNLKRFNECDVPFLQFILSMCGINDVVLPDLSDFVSKSNKNNKSKNTPRKIGLIFGARTVPVKFIQGYLSNLIKILYDNHIELYNLSTEKIDSIYVNNDRAGRYIDMPKIISEMDFIISLATGLHVITLALGIPNILILPRDVKDGNTHGKNMARSSMSSQQLDKLVDTQDYWYSQESPPEELAKIILNKLK